MFSVTPEPAVSKSAYDPQARQARADQPPSDDFAALVDSNAAAASETDRPARPAPDAPRRDTRGTNAPAQNNDRPQADASTASSNKESGTAKQDGQSSAPADAAGNTSTDKTKAASGDSKTEDKPQDSSAESDAAVAAVTPVIPAIVTDPVAVVIAAAAAPTATGDEAAAATTVAATAAIASASAVTTPVDASAAQTPGVAEADTTGATVTTAVTAPAIETTAPETAAATISAAATVIKSDKTEIVAKDGEAAPAKDGKDSKDSKLAADPSAKPVSDQAIKPEAGAANTDDKPAQQQATAESGKADTEKHAGKAAPQAEHNAAAPTPQQALLTDPGLLPPTGIQPQPIQTHAANLTAIAVPTANTALADSAPVPLNGLAADIALRAAGGNSRFDIRLDPAELGRIDVRLDVDKHGNVTSHLTVERPATLDMLRNDAPRLQQALEDAGLKTGDSGLQFSLRDQSSSGRDSDNGSGRNSQRVVITEEDTVPAQVAGRTYGRMLGASSGVDIRI